ncbi:MAG: hypothetical protein JWM90_2355 [Thermoleophilia bacterium]|nr:hypothetical protein [Thermoleophilia bacterium]
MPGLRWNPQSPSYGKAKLEVPSTPQALDAIQVGFRHVADPIDGKWHSYMEHHHLSFNREAGQDKFRTDINEMFQRRGVAFELHVDGTITRLGPPAVREELSTAIYSSSDDKLDGLMESARRKFLDPDSAVRRESLDPLWDAFERLKTIEHSDKKTGSAALLAGAFPDEETRKRAEAEMLALTAIGNDFDIRHHETTKIQITDPADVDYFFSRAYALMHVLLTKTGRLSRQIPTEPASASPFDDLPY